MSSCECKNVQTLLKISILVHKLVARQPSCLHKCSWLSAEELKSYHCLSEVLCRTPKEQKGPYESYDHVWPCVSDVYCPEAMRHIVRKKTATNRAPVSKQYPHCHFGQLLLFYLFGRRSWRVFYHLTILCRHKRQRFFSQLFCLSVHFSSALTFCCQFTFVDGIWDRTNK